MRRVVLFLTMFGMLGFLWGVAPAHAQAVRTWISGVGDDANPCSRTAPCKTFAGAISKTAAGGEINCLDPGGFGAVTITKSIALICDYTEGGISASGFQGIVVNAGLNDVVFISGLDIEGINSATNGINFINGKALHVRHTIIRGFMTNGINFAPTSTSASLVVQDSVIADGGGGILVKPAAGFNATGTITDTQMDRNTFGLRVEDRGKITVVRSTASNNSANGMLVVATAAAAEINVVSSVSANNGTNGFQTNGAGGATIRLLNTGSFANATGVNTTPGGTIAGTTPDTNSIVGNTTTDGTVNGNVNLQ